MPRKTLTQDQLRSELLFEAHRAELEAMPHNIEFFQVEEGGGWTVSFDGPLMFSPDAAKFGAIITRLSAMYAIKWTKLH